jgi:hypothetical protein
MGKTILVHYVNVGKYKGVKLEKYMEDIMKKNSQKEGDFLEYFIPTNGESKVECIYPNNIPIHIHEGVKNIHVYIENGTVNIKPSPEIMEQVQNL